MITWLLIIIIFAIAAALVFILGVKIGEEKMRNEQADNERHDENHWQ